MGGIYWLASYPKSGNTWFRTFMQNLLADGESPVDINELSTGGIAGGRGWLDAMLGFDTADLTQGEVERLRPAVYDWCHQDETPSHIKIHDALTRTCDGLPLIGRAATLGALYIIRNPLDVAPSFANHNHCSIDKAIKQMGRPDLTLAPSRNRLDSQVSQRLLSWSEHVRSWVDADDIAVHVIRYEDMLASPQATFGAAARFLDLPTDPGRIDKAIRFSDFRVLARQEEEKGFKETPARTERFFRQGKSGGWREQLSPEQVRQVIDDHGEVMRRFGYLDQAGQPL